MPRALARAARRPRAATPRLSPGLDRERIGTPFASGARMEKTWKAPEFEELHLGSEMDAQSPDDDDPSLAFIAKTVIRQRPLALERRVQRSRGAARGRR
jgi:hypothetical protein